jgi:hypothetical protein
MPVFRNGNWTQIFGSAEAARRFNTASHPRMRARPNRMRLNQIREAQRQLRDLGFYKRQIDGIDGAHTKQAVEHYKKKYLHDHEVTPGLAAALFGNIPFHFGPGG